MRLFFEIFKSLILQKLQYLSDYLGCLIHIRRTYFMFKRLHRWAIEVDQNHQIPNFKAQRSFIRDFGKSLYQSVDDPSSSLHSLQYVYFTRIFWPQRDKMGAYIRLHFFVEESLLHPARMSSTRDWMY